jgi:hypothetical protein
MVYPETRLPPATHAGGLRLRPGSARGGRVQRLDDQPATLEERGAIARARAIRAAAMGDPFQADD